MTPPSQERAREDILRNDPASLAAALRGIGTGAMAPLWDRLGELAGIDTLVVTAGERRQVRARSGRAWPSSFPVRATSSVAGAGHALPRERPDELAALLDGA